MLLQQQQRPRHSMHAPPACSLIRHSLQPASSTPKPADLAGSHAVWAPAQPLTVPPLLPPPAPQVFEFYPEREVMHSRRRRNAEELGLEARDVSLFR